VLILLDVGTAPAAR